MKVSYVMMEVWLHVSSQSDSTAGVDTKTPKRQDWGEVRGSKP